MDWLEVLSKFLETILIGILPVIAVFIVKWLRAKIEETLASADAQSPEMVQILEWVAALAVKAAEEANLAGLIEDKKKYAIQIIQAYLDSEGLHIDISLIEAAIEAAVLEEFNKEKAASLSSYGLSKAKK